MKGVNGQDGDQERCGVTAGNMKRSRCTLISEKRKESETGRDEQNNNNQMFAL